MNTKHFNHIRSAQWNWNLVYKSVTRAKSISWNNCLHKISYIKWSLEIWDATVLWSQKKKNHVGVNLSPTQPGKWLHASMWNSENTSHLLNTNELEICPFWVGFWPKIIKSKSLFLTRKNESWHDIDSQKCSTGVVMRCNPPGNFPLSDHNQICNRSLRLCNWIQQWRNYF